MPKEIINLSIIPKTSGIYQFFGTDDEVLYIGKAKNLNKRLQNYTQTNRLSNRIARMVFLARKLEITQTESELEALLLEHNLIKKFNPKFNILLRDDKTFPHIFISNHQFPQISKHRGIKIEKGEYFGPFASATDVNKTLDILKKSFLLRTCSDIEFRKRIKPCLEYQIKRCSAPCVNLINKDDYKSLVKNAVDFLDGKSVVIQQELAKKMQQFSEIQEYEKAAIIRDRIKSLTSIQLKQNININEINNADIITIVNKDDQICIYISFFRGGNNYGSKPYFYEMNEMNLAEILSGFLGQFYLTQSPPELILLNLEIEETELIEDFLNNIKNNSTNFQENTKNLATESRKKITIKVPKQGEKLRIIKDQEQIALQNLEQKLSENISNPVILGELKELFELSEIPQRIEVYDNSHISTDYAVGVFITAGVNGFIKNGYRKFNIRFDEFDGRDDTAMLKEVLRRRFKKDKNNENLISSMPDFIIIDGGIMQLNAAKEIFDELKINPKFVSMSKGKNRNAYEEYFHQIGKESFTLAKNSKIMHYLQQLRDEAHRFAITTHRSKRAKSVNKSSLDEIDGIGQSRKKSLLNHFGSFDKIKSASIEDLIKLEGISKNLAKKIYNFCRN
jgi:excinuclease ABC subunit C